MSKSTSKSIPGALGAVVANTPGDDHIDLYEAMAILGRSRTTLYRRHPELPRFKVAGTRRVQTSRAAVERLARKLGIEVREVAP